MKERPDSAGNDARKIMDIELALIAEKLQIRLPYVRGERNDHRMWSDFAERLLADGKKCLQKKSGNDFPNYTAGLDALESAQRLLVGRGQKENSHGVSPLFSAFWHEPEPVLLRAEGEDAAKGAAHRPD